MIFYQVLVSSCLSIARGKGIRVDNGFEQGIFIYYDPMLAKLITYGETRGSNQRSMLSIVEGVQTTAFWEICNDAFGSGNFGVKKVLQCGIITKGNGARGQIALIALQNLNRCAWMISSSNLR
jgi:hypothetical protein